MEKSSNITNDISVKIGIIGERFNKIPYTMLTKLASIENVDLVWFVDATLSRKARNQFYGKSPFLFNAYKYLKTLVGRLNISRNTEKKEQSYDCMRLCMENGISYYKPKKCSVNNGLPSEMYDNPIVDYVMIFGCDQIINENGLRLARKRTINYHYSPLPRYRGKNALFWQWYNEEPYIGFSFHEVTEEIDAGEVILQGKVQYNTADSLEEVRDKVLEESSDALDRLLDCLRNGTTCRMFQNERSSFYSQRHFRELVAAGPNRRIEDLRNVYQRLGYLCGNSGIHINNVQFIKDNELHDRKRRRDAIRIRVKDGYIEGDIIGLPNIKFVKQIIIWFIQCFLELDR